MNTELFASYAFKDKHTWWHIGVNIEEKNEWNNATFKSNDWSYHCLPSELF